MLEDSHGVPSGLINELLSDKSCACKHGKAAVLDFLHLHSLEFRGVLGAETEGIESDVTGSVIVTDEELLGRIRRGHPANLCPVYLGDTDEENEGLPEGGRHLGKVVDSGAGYGRIEKEGGALDLLANEETNESEHGNPSMGELGLAVALAL